MKFKRFLAFTVVATMVAGSTLTAFADEGVTGAGVIEYDDSTAIKYDQVVVPTLAAGAYNFTMDPAGLLNEYGVQGDTYVEGQTVYFKTTENKAYIEAAGNGVILKDKYEVVDPTDEFEGIYEAFATGTITEGVASVTTVTAGKYLWIPSTAYEGSGSSGEYLLITKDNIADYFDFATSSTDGALDCTFRADHKAGAKVCSGVIYTNTGESIGNGSANAKAKIVDTDADPLSNYVTVDNTGAITAVTGLYKGTVATAATKDDFTYTAATTHYTGRTDTVYVKNLSTKSKTVTAKVTLKDATGLTINGSDTFTGDTVKAKAAIYVAAYGDDTAGDDPVVLAKEAEGDAISATITAVLDGADEDNQITYQTNEQNKFGGHKYKRYSAPDVTYADNAFYIVAKAAPKNDDNEDAWAEYFEAAEKAPSLNIVYTVKNTNAEDDEEEEEEEEVVVQPTEAYATVELRGSNNYFLVSPTADSTFTDVTAKTDITSFEAKLNDGEYVDVMDIAVVSGGRIGAKYNDLKTPLGFSTLTTGDKITAKIVIGDTTYVATYTR